MLFRSPLAAEELRQPLARVESHPQRPSLLGLRNLSPDGWLLQRLGGEVVPVAPGETVSLAGAERLHTGAGVLTIEP